MDSQMVDIDKPEELYHPSAFEEVILQPKFDNDVKVLVENDRSHLVSRLITNNILLPPAQRSANRSSGFARSVASCGAKPPRTAGL
jgi:hypothetical protein